MQLEVVTGRRERWDDDDIPWFRCSTPTECLENAAKEKEGVRFVVTFETIGNYLLRSQEICGRLSSFFSF